MDGSRACKTQTPPHVSSSWRVVTLPRRLREKEKSHGVPEMSDWLTKVDPLDLGVGQKDGCATTTRWKNLARSTTRGLQQNAKMDDASVPRRWSVGCGAASQTEKRAPVTPVAFRSFHYSRHTEGGRANSSSDPVPAALLQTSNSEPSGNGWATE